MKFTINSKVLLSMVNAIGKLVPSKPVIMIQGSFLINLHDGMIEITASDTENRGTIAESCETEGEGKFCIDARFITDILNAVSDAPITVEVDENNEATISTTTGSYKTVATNGDKYPMSNFDETPIAEFNIPTDKLIGGISDVAFAIGSDDFHPQMMGVCMDVKDDKVVFCATDTRQMARSIQTDFPVGVEAKCILSPKTMTALNGLVSKVDVVGVSIYPSAVEFNGNNFTLHSQLIKGNYPDYNRVIPTDNNIEISIPRTDLINVIRRVSICADQQYCLIKFQFSLGSIDVTAQDVSMGKRAKDVVTCDYNGPDFVMGFSCKYLTGILKSIPTENVVFKIKDNSRPALIQPSGDDQHLTILLMPMNVNS